MLQIFTERLPHSRHRCTEENQASVVPGPMRCPGWQRHSKEALITQIVKGTKLLKNNNNNTLVHTLENYPQMLMSDPRGISGICERNQLVVCFNT